MDNSPYTSFHIVTYYINRGTTSCTYSIFTLPILYFLCVTGEAAVRCQAVVPGAHVHEHCATPHGGLDV